MANGLRNDLATHYFVEFAANNYGEQSKSEARSGKCLTASLQGPLPRSLVSTISAEIKFQAVASHPASRRPGGTGQLPKSGQEAVPDTSTADSVELSRSRLMAL